MSNGLEIRRAKFKAKVHAWAKKLKVNPRQVRVQQMRRKWGSCSTLGYVSFANDLLKKRSDVQEYVIVHELLHLRIPNHSSLFKLTLLAHFPAGKKYWNPRVLRSHGKAIVRRPP